MSCFVVGFPLAASDHSSPPSPQSVVSVCPCSLRSTNTRPQPYPPAPRTSTAAPNVTHLVSLGGTCTGGRSQRAFILTPRAPLAPRLLCGLSS